MKITKSAELLFQAVPRFLCEDDKKEGKDVFDEKHLSSQIIKQNKNFVILWAGFCA